MFMAVSTTALLSSELTSRALKRRSSNYACVSEPLLGIWLRLRIIRHCMSGSQLNLSTDGRGYYLDVCLDAGLILVLRTVVV